MTVSVVSLCNAALTRLGAKQITALSEDSKEGKFFNANFELIRDTFLDEANWKFAQKRQVLAASATAPAFEWSYAYPLPNDCIRVIRTFDETNRYVDYTYTIEAGELLSDQTTVKIEYIFKQTDYTKWSALALDAFIQRLAAEAAYPISGVTAMGNAAWELYRTKVQAAMLANERQGSPREYVAEEWNDSRFTGDY